jgi:hypothetical protein
MNVEMLKRVRDAIAGEGEESPVFTVNERYTGDDEDNIVTHSFGFNMGSFLCTNPEAPCGTAMCIGGWTVALAARDEGRTPSVRNFTLEEAAEILDLYDAEDISCRATRLFFAIGAPTYCLGQIPRAHALEVLDHLIATGEVNWNLPGAIRHYRDTVENSDER